MKSCPLYLKFIIVMATCSFQELVGGVCGGASKGNTKCIYIGSCGKNVKSHLKTYCTYDSTISSESDLILARAGVFDIQEHHMKLFICPRHRDDLGLRWKSNKKYCCCPPNWAPHKEFQRKGDRGLTRDQSRILLASTSILIPVGSPICKRCRTYLNDLKSSSINVSLDSPKVLCDNERTLEEEESFKNLEDDIEEIAVRFSSFNVSNYLPDASTDSDGSDSTETDEKDGNDTVDRKRLLLNEFLTACGREITNPLKKVWGDLSERSKHSHALKAGNAVLAVLEVIVPNNVPELWETMKSLKSVESAMGINQSYSQEEKMYLEALSESYQNADSVYTRRQILSILVDLVPYSSIKAYIPGVTDYKIKIARHHQLEHGRGTLISTPRSPRMKVDPLQLDNFLTFITTSHVVQDIPFGQRRLKLSNGKILEIPNVIRTMIPQRIADQYEQYCKETNFKPFSKSTMLRILSSCSASTRTSLQGLDYFAADGAKGFDDLASIVDKLVDISKFDREEGQRIKNDLKGGKLYIKDDYKVHASDASTIPDHCIPFSLSDKTDECFQKVCDHRHDHSCENCDSLRKAINDVETAINAANLPIEDHDDVLFAYKEASQAILAWKAHQVRSLHQDKSRIDVIDKLDHETVLITEDWAMKFLPQRYRESQTDWFAKRGISWHISVIVRRVNNELQQQAFVHIVTNTSQDSETVIQLIKHTLMQLKDEHKEIKTAYLRQDNAACYHNAPLLACCHLLKETGINVKQVDFSDSQGGKGPCDRKAATIKAHVRRFINEGNDVISASDLEKAILSYGGVNGVRVSLVDMERLQLQPVKWKGISTFSNFSYEDNSCTVWKAYKIGTGQTIQYSDLAVHARVIVCSFENTKFSDGDFITNSFKRTNDPRKKNDERNTEENADGNDNTGELFTCPVDGCRASFAKKHNLDNHLNFGKCKFTEEKTTLMDKAQILYQKKIDEGSSSQPSISHNSEAAVSYGLTSMTQGWALKTTKATVRFNKNQTSYLDDKFQMGQDTGKKCDPNQVAKDMRREKTKSGSRRFALEEFLTSKQIQSYFSRKASKLKHMNVEEMTQVDRAIEEEASYADLRSQVVEECELRHPIVYDDKDLCRLYVEGKLEELLKGLTVSELSNICIYFHIEVDSLPKRRKMPYITLLSELVTSCSCTK